MGDKIFISYRRQDSAANARSIYQRLERRFGARRLFIDVDTIRKGRDFVSFLQTSLRQSQAMLVIIGPNWLDARDEHGRRRLDDPDDYVRQEVAGALQLDIAVIPVLVDGASLPKPSVLPPDIASLSQRQSIVVGHDSFGRDMLELERELADGRRSTGSIVAKVSIAAFVALTMAAALYWYGLANLSTDLLSALNPREQTQSIGEQAVRVRRAADESFRAKVKVNGAWTNMAIDTNTKFVVLKSEDGKRAGIDVDKLSYPATVQLASGLFYSAPVRLESVEVGPIVVQNVEALVTPPNTLKESILGKSFMSRLRSFEQTGDFLTMRN